MAMNWAQFTAQPNGTRIYNHGYDQCVALANQYHEEVIGGSFVPVGSAFQWWTEYSSQPNIYSKYVQARKPVAGAIFVARYGIYDAPNGHIGVVTSVNNDGTFQTMEQNAGTWRYLGRYTRTLANVLGFLIPKNNPAGDDDVVTQQDKQDIAELVAETLRHHQRENGRAPDASAGRTLFDLGQESADGLTDARAASIQHLFQHNLRENGFGWQEAEKNGKTLFEYLRELEKQISELRAEIKAKK